MFLNVAKENEEPPHLLLENVLSTDVGSYKCRVDFYKAPTQISEVVLNVIGKMGQVSSKLAITFYLLSSTGETQNIGRARPRGATQTRSIQSWRLNTHQM